MIGYYDWLLELVTMVMVHDNGYSGGVNHGVNLRVLVTINMIDYGQ